MSHVVQGLLYLLLICSHHVSTTYGASIAAREEAAAEAVATTTTAPESEPEPAPVKPDHNSGELSLDPEANHKVTLNAQNEILEAGESLSLGLTQTIISPFVFVNQQISQAASALPAIMAANGAILGTAIATPIQVGTLAANHMAAGVTGTLVSIPVSLVSGGTAQLIGIVESGRELYHGQVAALSNSLRISLPQFIRPAAIISGANAVVGGIALGALSNGVQRIGQSVNLMGTSLTNAGQGLAGFGNGLALWAQEANEEEQGATEAALEVTSTEEATTTSAPL